MSTSRRVNTHRQQLIAGLLSAATVAGFTVSAWAASPIIIPADNSNFEIQRKSSDGSTAASQAQPWSGMRIGYQAGMGSQSGGFGYGGIDAVLFFQIPTAPAGEVISSASLSVGLMKNSESNAVAPAFNVDLYALGFDKNSPPDNEDAGSDYAVGGVPSTTVAPAYFYVGPTQPAATITAVNPNNAPLAEIQTSLLTPTDWNAAQTASGNDVVRSTTTMGGNALANYVQGLYANSQFTAGHDSLILRLNPDTVPTNTHTLRYQIAYAQTPTYNDGGIHTPTSTDPAIVPTLSVTFALPGDANSDGKINADDYALIDRGALRVTTGILVAGSTQWTDGDFNHDGTVNAADYMIIDTAYSHAHGGTPDSLLSERETEFGAGYVSALVASVPEPTSLGLLASVGSLLLARRRPLAAE